MKLFLMRTMNVLKFQQRLTFKKYYKLFQQFKLMLKIFGKILWSRKRNLLKRSWQKNKKLLKKRRIKKFLMLKNLKIHRMEMCKVKAHLGGY